MGRVGNYWCKAEGKNVWEKVEDKAWAWGTIREKGIKPSLVVGTIFRLPSVH